NIELLAVDVYAPATFRQRRNDVAYMQGLGQTGRRHFRIVDVTVFADHGIHYLVAAVHTFLIICTVELVELLTIYGGQLGTLGQGRDYRTNRSVHYFIVTA